MMKITDDRIGAGEPDGAKMADDKTVEERNETLVAEKGERAIYSFEIRKPDGIWITMFRGQDTILTADGGETDAPAHPTFPTEEQARRWLEARKDLPGRF